MSLAAVAGADFDAIPIIDLSPFIGGTDRAAVVGAVRDACERVGFLVISGHAVPPATIEAVHREAARFFALPVTEKLSARPPGQRKARRGYTPVGERALASTQGQKTLPDLRETFTAMKIDGWPEWYKKKIADPEVFTPNVWPDALPGFRTACTNYYREMERLSRVLANLFAAALGLPESWFDDKLDQHISKLMVANYPAQDAEPPPGQLRAGVHTDFGSWTIIHQDDAPGGLQVRNSAGAWIDVPAIRDTFVINLGDLMARWTNDRWVSTLHRVCNPPTTVAADARRLSLIFFHQPNFDAVIECIPTCRQAGEAPLYAPVTSGAHLEGQMRITIAGAAG